MSDECDENSAIIEIRTEQKNILENYKDIKSDIAIIKSDVRTGKHSLSNAMQIQGLQLERIGIQLSKLLELEEEIHGSGNEPGIKGRLQRLEDTETIRREHIRKIWLVISGVLVKLFWDIIQKIQHP